MPTNLTDADLAAIEALGADYTAALERWQAHSTDSAEMERDKARAVLALVLVAHAPALFAALRTAWAERDAAYAAADDLEGKYRQLVTAHDELTTALNAAAMEVNARRFWGTRMIESIPSYLREVGKRIAALERERDEARRLADRLLLACDRAHELKDTRNE